MHGWRPPCMHSPSVLVVGGCSPPLLLINRLPHVSLQDCLDPGTAAPVCHYCGFLHEADPRVPGELPPVWTKPL